MNPVPAAILLAAAGTAALLAGRMLSVAAITVVLLLLCLRAPRRRRALYLFGALTPAAGIFVLSPFLSVAGGGTLLWEGPTLPVLGPVDLTTDEMRVAAIQALRFSALALAFSAYALLLDHDRLLGAVGFARRSSIAVALATRLVPTLERDAAGLAEAVRGRGVAIEGVRGHARLLSPLVAGSLERASNLAEAMEARGYGRGQATRAPRPRWGRLDRSIPALSAALVAVAVLWL